MKSHTLGLSALSLSLLAPLCARADEPVTATFTPVVGQSYLALPNQVPSHDPFVIVPPPGALAMPMPVVPAPQTDRAIVIGPKKPETFLFQTAPIIPPAIPNAPYSFVLPQLSQDGAPYLKLNPNRAPYNFVLPPQTGTFKVDPPYFPLTPGITMPTLPAIPHIIVPAIPATPPLNGEQKPK